MKEWVFAHNGMVPDIVEIELSSGNPVCCPTGGTDSEYAFCHILHHIAQHFHSLPLTETTTWFENLAVVSGLVASLGKFNFLMSDGEHLVAYGHDRLHYLERSRIDQSDGILIDSALVATEPLDKTAAWIPFQRGELRLYRSGKMIGRMMTKTVPPFNSARY